MNELSLPEHVAAEVEAMTNDLVRDDDMGAVIRAHIRIEQELNAFIDCRLVDPSQLKAMSLDFDQKVSLALALGFVKRFGKPLRAMGSLRNKFAHKMGVSLDASTVTALYETFEAEEKAQINDTFASIGASATLLGNPATFKKADPKQKFGILAIHLWGAVKMCADHVRSKKKPA